jgi:hypothetical protein
MSDDGSYIVTLARDMFKDIEFKAFNFLEYGIELSPEDFDLNERFNELLRSSYARNLTSGKIIKIYKYQFACNILLVLIDIKRTAQLIKLAPETGYAVEELLKEYTRGRKLTNLMRGEYDMTTVKEELESLRDILDIIAEPATSARSSAQTGRRSSSSSLSSRRSSGSSRRSSDAYELLDSMFVEPVYYAKPPQDIFNINVAPHYRPSAEERSRVLNYPPPDVFDLNVASGYRPSVEERSQYFRVSPREERRLSLPVNPLVRRSSRIVSKRRSSSPKNEMSSLEWNRELRTRKKRMSKPRSGSRKSRRQSN